jgi:cation diffusion facilitator family transporter
MASSSRSRALALSFFTVGYNVVEGIVSVVAAVLAGSTALLGFGLDSFVESLSGVVMIWRFWKHGTEADEDGVAESERKAIRLVAYTFFILGAYVVFDASKALYMREEPETSVVGLVIAVASLVVMPTLFIMKYRLGKSIGSRSLVADSKETLACVLLSVALLVGLGSNYLWRIWWVDPAAALIIGLLIFREGYETLEESNE